jgi:predicted dehydrogenase
MEQVTVHRIAIVGFGKIAQDQHVPSVAGNPAFELAATVSRSGGGPGGLPTFQDVQDLLAANLGIDSVAICTPPSVRYEVARDCLAAGLHTLLEKPPGVTLGECEELARLAGEKGVALFTTWHAQYNPAVTAAAERLVGKRIKSMRIVWREDVRKWHPGQQWIWEPGGFGVFDPGINALSIAARIFPGELFVREAELMYPENKQAPIAARLKLATSTGKGELNATFDWRHSGEEAWDIDIAAADGTQLKLSHGGSRLFVAGEEQACEGEGEYPSLYAEFVDLIDERRSHADIRPLRLVADAYLAGRRSFVEPFEDG